MSTLYEQLKKNIAAKTVRRMIGKHHRSILGHTVLNHFKASCPGQRYEKVQSLEDGGMTLTVNNYPVSFTPEIDKLIKTYYEDLAAAHEANKKSERPQLIKRAPRPRKAAKKLIYSTSGKN